jgi:putative component of toxin-antitoxin plasmid stabilization module
MFEIRRTDRFDKWLKGLADKKGKALISDRIERLAQGHMGDAKVVGNGVTELRVHFRPATAFILPNAAQHLSCCCVEARNDHKYETLNAQSKWRGSWRNKRYGY